MKSYACYPGSKLHPLATLVTPAYPRTYSREYRKPTANFPATNIIRNDNGFVIEMAVPGMTREQLSIQVDNDQLIISATPTTESAKPNYLRNEFDYTNFKRIFRLPKNANTEIMTAAVNQGVLTISVPDKEPAVRKIDIQ